ncbi:hypothetical protein [Candidatus Palauibacter sp.]|uniref:hypothetical protein n=1 Tax=Candidatus Palauibacter sp. TaxID=3101350 RepID=UPI003B01D4B0
MLTRRRYLTIGIARPGDFSPAARSIGMGRTPHGLVTPAALAAGSLYNGFATPSGRCEVIALSRSPYRKS